MISPDQKIRIKIDSKFIDAVTLSSFFMKDKTYWWVQYTTKQGYFDCALYSEEDLISFLPDEDNSKKCTCGADFLNHPAHSKWCDVA